MNFLSNIWNGITNTVSGAWNSLTNATNKVASNISNAWESIPPGTFTAATANAYTGDKTSSPTVPGISVGSPQEPNVLYTPPPAAPAPNFDITQPPSSYLTASGVRPSTYNPSSTPMYGPTAAPKTVAPDQYGRVSNADVGAPYVDPFSGQWVVPKTAFAGVSGAGGSYAQTPSSNLATQGAQGTSNFTGTLGGTSGLSTPALPGSVSTSTDEENKRKQQQQANPFGFSASTLTTPPSSVLNPQSAMFGVPAAPINVQPAQQTSLNAGPVAPTVNAGDLNTARTANTDMTSTSQYSSSNDRGETNAKLNQSFTENYNKINQASPTPSNPVEDTKSQADAIASSPDGLALKNAMDTWKAQNTQLGELTTQRINVMKQVQAINDTYTGAINEIKNNPNLPKGLAVRRLEALNTSSKNVLQGFVNQLEILNQSIDDQNKAVDRTFQIAQFAQQTEDKKREFAMSTLQLMVTSHAIGGFSDADIATFSKSLNIPASSLRSMKEAANQPDMKVEGSAKDGFYSTSINRQTGTVTIKQLTQPITGLTTDQITPGTAQFKVAQDLAYGTLTFSQFKSLYSYSKDSTAKVAIYEKASQLNPNFNPSSFELGYKVASNPKIRQQISALDNVVDVTDHLLNISSAAARSGITTLNKGLIAGGIMIGNKNYSNLAAAQTAYADELSGALGFGSATDMTRQLGFDLTNTALSPEAFAASINEVVLPFIQSKRDSIVNQMGIYGAAVNQMSNGGAAGNDNDPLKLF